MIRKIKSWWKVWRLKDEIRTIEEEIDDFYLTLLTRNDEFQSRLDIDKLHQKYVNLRKIEISELTRQINKIKKS